MLNLLRKFLRPTLREQLEDGLREGLRRYADRHVAPNLRVYASTDLIPAGVEPSLWARDETEHLRRFALQWAEDNSLPSIGMRIEVILLDTKRSFAFVKPVGAEPALQSDAASGRPGPPPPPTRPMVEAKSVAAAFLEVVESPSLRDAVRIEGETTVGRKPEGAAVKGLGDRYMSARHARFHLSSGKLFVTDLDSRNRTFLNDEPLPPHQAVSVAVGDTIRMGTTTLRLARIG
jgi:hypothetical protein